MVLFPIQSRQYASDNQLADHWVNRLSYIGNTYQSPLED